jgi:hypothetical protein
MKRAECRFEVSSVQPIAPNRFVARQYLVDFGNHPLRRPIIPF